MTRIILFSTLLFFKANILLAFDFIEGFIVDPSGKAIEEVIVRVDQTTLQTLSDEKGYFLLKIPKSLVSINCIPTTNRIFETDEITQSFVHKKVYEKLGRYHQGV